MSVEVHGHLLTRPRETVKMWRHKLQCRPQSELWVVSFHALWCRELWIVSTRFQTKLLEIGKNNRFLKQSKVVHFWPRACEARPISNEVDHHHQVHQCHSFWKLVKFLYVIDEWCNNFSSMSLINELNFDDNILINLTDYWII